MSKIKFGAFSAMQAGQKNATVNAEPRLIANSTVGKFTATSPVTKALNVAVGENIMFLNNIEDVEKALNAETKPEVFVQWANENDVDLNTAEGKQAARDYFVTFAIAKGVPQYDSKGNPVMGSLRYTRDEKMQYIAENGAALIANDEIRNMLIERVGNADASDEELIAAITVDDIESPQYHTSTGSKTASTSTATGVGLQLSFTDTAIWNTLKSDLGNDKDGKNRIFNVCLTDGFTAQVHDGQKVVDVLAFPIEFVEDTDPIVRGEK